MQPAPRYTADGEEVQVAERHEGEFVGEMGVKINASEVADGWVALTPGCLIEYTDHTGFHQFDAF
jgi:CRP-like cAMP-binding protein